MFDSTLSQHEILPPETPVQTADPDMEIIFSFPLAETKKALIPRDAFSPARPKIRVVFLPYPELKEKFSFLPTWLREFVGWGVFLALLGAFLSLQIVLNRIFNSPWSQIITIITVFVEISLLWRWDQYWY